VIAAVKAPKASYGLVFDATRLRPAASAGRHDCFSRSAALAFHVLLNILFCIPFTVNPALDIHALNFFHPIRLLISSKFAKKIGVRTSV
jgi:hypothetical protein